jgi:hypothetical protein
MTNVEEEKPVLGIRGRSETRSFLKEWFDLEFKAVGYLLAAHAAGMIACLSVLKDYKDNPQLKGIGIFVILFGLGLIFTAFAFAFLAASIEAMYRYIIYGDAKAELSTKVCSITYLVFATASGVLFLIGVGIGIFRFGGL